MKKIATLLLTAMVTMTVASCTPKDPGTTTPAGGTTTAGEATTPGETTTGGKVTDPKTTITVQAEETWMPYYEKTVARVKEKYPESTVTLVEVGAFPNLDTIDSTDAVNADVPDVFALPADRLPSMINKEALTPMPAAEMAKAIGGYDDFESIGSILKDGDDYLAFPMNIETLITFVNPTNAEAMNVDLTKPYEIKGQEANELAVEYFNAWFGVALTNAADIELLGKDGDQFVTDMTKDWADLEPAKQTVITEIYNYWKRAYTDSPALWDEDTAGSQITEQFKDGGNVVFRIDGPWATPGLVEEIPSLDVLPLSHITIDGAPLKQWQGAWGLGINSRNDGDDAKMTLAQEFIIELLNPEFAEDFFEITGKIMPNVSAETYEATGLSEIEKKTISATIKSFETSENRPLFSEWGDVWDTWKNALLSWNASNPASAEEAYQAIKDSFKAMMSTLSQ